MHELRLHGCAGTGRAARRCPLPEWGRAGRAGALIAHARHSALATGYASRILRRDGLSTEARERMIELDRHARARFSAPFVERVA